MSKKNPLQAGFTIIEVLIVLAIAGLILLIVFLAVPALQRNSRNTQYREEASQLLSAATEYMNNHNGAVLVAADADDVYGLTKVKNIASITIQAENGGTTPTLTTAVLRTGAKCNVNNDTDPGSTRQISLLFMVETSGDPIQQCVDS